MTADLFDVPEGAQNISDDVLEEIEVLDQHILACFRSRHGKKVLAHMEAISQQPSFDANLGLFNGIANGFAREGQVALVGYLKKRMERAEKAR